MRTHVALALLFVTTGCSMVTSKPIETYQCNYTSGEVSTAGDQPEKLDADGLPTGFSFVVNRPQQNVQVENENVSVSYEKDNYLSFKQQDPKRVYTLNTATGELVKVVTSTTDTFGTISFTFKGTCQSQ